MASSRFIVNIKFLNDNIKFGRCHFLFAIFKMAIIASNPKKIDYLIRYWFDFDYVDIKSYVFLVC